MTVPYFQIRDVRIDDAEALAHILVTANRAVFQGRIPDQCLTLTEPQSAANWRSFLSEEGLPPGDVFVVAEPPGGVPIGYAWGGLQEEMARQGELRQIYILPALQRQGLGRRLISHVADRLAAQGIRQLCVGVLAVNPNRVFYERLGARYLKDRELHDEGVVLRELVYRWEQLPVGDTERA